jgi:hypothetical protein
MTDSKKEENEKELDLLFNQKLSKESFAKIIGKARRRTILRNAVISALVLFFLIILLGFTWLSIMRWSEANARRDIELFSEITSPNIEESGVQQEGNGLFEGILTFNRYKEIEGIPVDWSERVMTYSLFGGVSRFAGDHSPIQIQDESVGQLKSYDRETKQRMLNFYHPEVEYNLIANELGELESFSDVTIAEVALSFDQSYTPEEVRDSLPEGLTLKWYWTDTYSTADIERMNVHQDQAGEGNSTRSNTSPELATEVYGFGEIIENPSMSEQRFINNIEVGLSIEDGKYFGEFERIHNNLKGESTSLTEDKIKIIGAVVTGAATDLPLLENLEMIRASVIGVTVNQYK